jgi:hypothetical protein
MAGKSIQNSENIDDSILQQSLKQRQEEFKVIDEMVEAINESKDDISSIILGIERNGNMTYKSWVGSLNGCYGLARRLQLNIEGYMPEFGGEECDQF